MRVIKALALAGLVWLTFGSTAFAQVRLSIGNGRVSIAARDATLRQILAEWAKVGQTRIVNVERVPGGPMTIELTNVPEQEALDILLRAVSGYMASARDVIVPNASQFDRIIVMPTVAPARAPVTAAAAAPQTFPQAPTFPQPTVQAAPFLQQQQQGEEQEDRFPRGPVFQTFPQPQVITPQQQVGVPASTPGIVAAPPQGQQPNVQIPNLPFGGYPPATPGAQPAMPAGGVAVPGMIVQPPPQPGQVQPGQQQPPRQR